jgi:hypothetical protein
LSIRPTAPDSCTGHIAADERQLSGLVVVAALTFGKTHFSGFHDTYSLHREGTKDAKDKSFALQGSNFAQPARILLQPCAPRRFDHGLTTDDADGTDKYE